MADRASPVFDPYAILAALESQRVTFVVIGAFARVIHGTGELTDGIDITPSTRDENLARLTKALVELDARRRGDGKVIDLAQLHDEPVAEFDTNAGELKLVPEPAGTRGYDDLRRRANREALGEGLRPPVADPADLVRMLEAHDDPVRDLHVLPIMRRLVELA